MKINRTLLIIFPVLLFAGCRYQAVTDDGISIESLQDKLQVNGKGQFRSLTLGYVADSGDTCTITVYARERIETYSKVWTGYGCIYPEDIHYWHADKEDIGKLVGIISGNKYLRRYRGRKKTEKETIELKKIVITSKGKYELTEEGEPEVRAFVGDMFRAASAMKPLNEEGRRVIIPEIRFVLKDHHRTWTMLIEKTGTVIVKISGLYSLDKSLEEDIEASMLTSAEVSKLQLLINKLPKNGIIDEETAGRPNMDDPAELKVVALNIKGNIYRFISTSPPDGLAVLSSVMQGILDRIMIGSPGDE